MKSLLQRLIGQQHPLRLLWHLLKSLLAAAREGFPAKRLTVVGITGTDGKTTTTGMVAHVLQKSGRKTAAASTAFTQIGDDVVDNPTHLTSISPASLQKLLRRAADGGCTHAVLECSSHGLNQHRLDSTWPAVAAITNLTLEHLDYHGTMDEYLKAKARLFRMMKPGGTKVLNREDRSWPILRTIGSGRTITFGWQPPAPDTLGDEHLWAEDVTATPGGCTATLASSRGWRLPLALHVPGTFNIQNAMCALACCLALGLEPQEIVAALGSFRGIPGRLERIDEGQAFSVFVDFAVSPNAYEQTLNTLRKMVAPTGRVLVLCSSCGNRMVEKRPLVGEVCSRLADVVMVTEDETYGEDPLRVLDEVWAGVDQTRTEAHKIPDRRAAILELLKMARPGDAVAICGMGPFSTMTKLEGRIPWDEREVTRELLQSLRA